MAPAAKRIGRDTKTCHKRPAERAAIRISDAKGHFVQPERGTEQQCGGAPHTQMPQESPHGLSGRRFELFPKVPA